MTDILTTGNSKDDVMPEVRQDSKSPCYGSHKIDGWVFLRSPSASAAWETRSQMNSKRKLKLPFEVFG